MFTLKSNLISLSTVAAFIMLLSASYTRQMRTQLNTLFISQSNAVDSQTHGKENPVAAV